MQGFGIGLQVELVGSEGSICIYGIQFNLEEFCFCNMFYIKVFVGDDQEGVSIFFVVLGSFEVELSYQDIEEQQCGIIGDIFQVF